MRTTLWMVAAASAGLLVGSAVPAHAITNGSPDGDQHPYVGLMVADGADGTPLWRCSGALVSPTVFLTAGHCTAAPAVRATIWFESDVQSNITQLGYPYGGPTSLEGTTFTHPLYDPAAFQLHDLGVVVLDEPVTLPEYAALPGLDALDGVKASKTTLDTVGYGQQSGFPPPASWKTDNQKVRMVAHPKILQIDTPAVGTELLLLSNNDNTGGTCYGDSGGPNLLAGTNVVVAVTSFERTDTCAGTGGAYRVDRADDLDWLHGAFGDQL